MRCEFLYSCVYVAVFCKKKCLSRMIKLVLILASVCEITNTHIVIRQNIFLLLTNAVIKSSNTTVNNVNLCTKAHIQYSQKITPCANFCDLMFFIIIIIY